MGYHCPAKDAVVTAFTYVRRHRVWGTGGKDQRNPGLRDERGRSYGTGLYRPEVCPIQSAGLYLQSPKWLGPRGFEGPPPPLPSLSCAVFIWRGSLGGPTSQRDSSGGNSQEGLLSCGHSPLELPTTQGLTGFITVTIPLSQEDRFGIIHPSTQHFNNPLGG